jgi:hypothetical protein
MCNQMHKRNRFPLRGTRARARSHLDDLSREEPLLINPTTDDPESMIGFRSEVAYPRWNSPRGRRTIDVVGLNRPELIERRRTALAILRVLGDQFLVVARKLAGQRTSAGRDRNELTVQSGRLRQVLDRHKCDDAEYAAMNRAAFP